MSLLSRLFGNIYKKMFFAFALIFLGVTLFCQASLLFYAVMMLWSGLMCYAICDLKNRAAYLVFLLAFFLFLLGGEFAELYLGYELEFSFPKDLDNHAYVCLLISLLFLHLGFCGLGKLLEKKKCSPLASGEHSEDPKDSISMKLKQPNPVWQEKMRQLAKWGMILAVIPWFWTILDAGLFTLEHGYLSYYTEYHSRVPTLVESISDLFTLFLFLYFATLPSKKACFIPMGLYLAHGVVALVTGRRISFGIAVLVLVFYVIFRQHVNPKERWIDKKIIVIVLVVCPVIAILMYVQRYVRYGEAVQSANPIDIVFRLLSQQGTSINVIKFQKQFSGDGLGCTSLYYTLHHLRGSLLTRHIFDFPLEYYATRTINTVFRTNCLADYIMYMVSPRDYFAGYGLGTSYIAELYHDLSYIGVALGSVIYGALLRGLYSAKNFSFWKFTIGLLMLEEFVILPRYGADVIFRPFYNLTRLAVLVLVIMWMCVSKEKINKAWSKIRKKGA